MDPLLAPKTDFPQQKRVQHRTSFGRCFSCFRSFVLFFVPSVCSPLFLHFSPFFLFVSLFFLLFFSFVVFLLFSSHFEFSPDVSFFYSFLSRVCLFLFLVPVGILCLDVSTQSCQPPLCRAPVSQPKNVLREQCFLERWWILEF